MSIYGIANGETWINFYASVIGGTIAGITMIIISEYISRKNVEESEKRTVLERREKIKYEITIETVKEFTKEIQNYRNALLECGEKLEKIVIFVNSLAKDFSFQLEGIPEKLSTSLMYLPWRKCTRQKRAATNS